MVVYASVRAYDRTDGRHGTSRNHSDVAMVVPLVRCGWSGSGGPGGVAARGAVRVWWTGA
jgi:hypothetical protein